MHPSLYWVISISVNSRIVCQLTNSTLRIQHEWTKQLTCATVRCPMHIGPFLCRRLLTPIKTLFTWYLFILKRAKCIERQVKVWDENSVARLQGCFDYTNWPKMRKHSTEWDWWPCYSCRSFRESLHRQDRLDPLPNPDAISERL